MKQLSSGILILLSCIFIWSCQPNRTFTENEIALIPKVQEMTLGKSSFNFRESTKLVVENIDQEVIALQFAELFKKATGWKLQVEIGGKKGSNQVCFNIEPGMAPEAYSLDIHENRIEIKATKPAGFFYAIQTLRQLLPPEIESNCIRNHVSWLVPVTSINDCPSFKWRGFMLDVSRHFFTKNEVLSMIDHLAVHKINTLHLHLVDDQGWRIEIKKYPKLTGVGAWRVDRENQTWKPRSKQKVGEKATYGGFYTQDDIREIVSYAQKRFINIVPEIEMPAHVISALAAYPEFSCTGRPLTVLPTGFWPITDIYCAGKDSTFLFLQDVLTEVIDLFPSKYIHIGADEATKTEWEKCPDCQKRIKAEGLKNVSELQNYFIRRIEKFISSKGRVLIGWDEIIEGELPQKAAVMSWRGIQGGIDASRQGHDVVMTPGTPCYLDNYQGPAGQEPMAQAGYNLLSKVYNFDPVPKGLDAEAARHILGAQGNLWSEYVPNFKHAEYMTFPRIAALAEVLWSPKELRNWDDFSRRIQLFMKRYDLMDINYSKSAYKITSEAAFNPEKKQLSVSLTSELANNNIHYTTDGTEPNLSSPVYTNPILLYQSAKLTAVTFVNENPTVKSISSSFSFNKATGKPVKYLVPYSNDYKGSGKYTLVNAARGTTNDSDDEWQAWAGKNMEVVIDLQDKTEIHKISVGSMQIFSSWIFFPKKVEFFVSDDGFKFQKIATVLNNVDPFSGEKQLKDFSATFNPTTAHFVKVVATNLGKAPKEFTIEDMDAWLFIDEISVE